ncbi:MAG: beta strand repeat-containing protein [Bacteroidia bacterium]
MRKILLFVFITFNLISFSQSDNCSSAATLTVNASCVGTPGTTAGATQSIPGCSGNADDDVWYKFTASATSQVITVNSSASFDAVAQLFSGTCSSLTNLYCQDVNFSGQSETIYATGLTAGNIYYIRVYNYGTGSGSSTFTICVSNPPAAPSNNTCGAATALAVNAACSYTAGTTYGATQSYTTTCGGTPDDDVWYTFVANNAQDVVTVTPSASMDAVVEILAGSCGAFTSLYCVDNGLTGGTETVNAIGLTPGTTYYIRVFDYYGGNGGFPFNICVTGASSTGDDPCNAFVLPVVTADCHYSQFSTTSASASMSAPTPASCGGSSPYQGGFSASSKDVWFKVVVPASGSLYITPQPNLGTGAITDGVMALYSGTCSSLTQVACSDDHSAYPGTANDLLPFISATGLTPGATYYIRFWGYGTSSGTFGLCVSAPTNDLCANALYICDLNGYSGATSYAYTKDEPCNMRGDNEDATGTPFASTGMSAPDGIYPAGIFGLGGTWGTGQPGTGPYDVVINNNSWIRFTASATTASFSVTVGDCWVGNYPSGGIQMQIFSGTACCNFIPVSDFKESSTGFVLTSSSLTAGQTYYLMIDGFNNDVCNYTIHANSGVLFPGITAAPSTICYTDSTTLTGPNGASSYQWSPGGQTSQSITVSPPATQNYTCVVSGVCGNKQTLTKTVTVNPLPGILINGAAASTVSVCTSSNYTLTASGGTSYSWSTGASTSTISVVAPAAGASNNYTVTGTDANGCKNKAVITVTGWALPTLTLTNASPSVCSGHSVTLTANPGTLTYSWSTGASGSSISVSPGSNTTYTVTGTDANGCKKSSTATVTVLSVPTIGVNSATICVGQAASLTANGGSTYSWSTSQTGTNISVSPGSSSSYTVVGTAANTCTNSAVSNVTVNSLPNVTVNSQVICNGLGATLNAGGASTYTWSNSSSGPSISVSPTTTTSYTVTGTNGNGCTKSAVSTVTVNPVPSISGSPTIAPSNCGGSTGSITGVNVTGSGSLSYTWTNSSNVVVGNTANISNLPAGTYNLAVTDANGCTSAFGPYSITNPGSPTAPSVVANDTTVCVGQTVTLVASSTTGGATLTWTGPGLSTNSPTVTLSPAQVNQSGVYSVYATSAGCAGPSKNITVTISPLPVVTAASQTNPYCSGTTINLSGSGGGSYSWSGPNTFTSSTQNPAIASSSTVNAGTYTLVVTDANGCVNSDTANVIVNQTPSVTSISATSPTLCAGQTIQLNANSTPAGATYSWSGPNGFSSASQNPTITNAGPIASGTYSVTTILTGCTSAVGTVAVTVNPNPTAQATISNTVICSGNNVNLGGNGGGTYSWSGPSSFSSSSQNPTLPNVSSAQSGTYTLVVTNAFNCTSRDSVSLTVNQTPTVTSVGSGTTICAGQTFTLGVVATPTNSIFSWTGPNSYTSSSQNNTIANATVTQSGTYSVVVGIGACSAPTSTVTITVNPNPVAVAAISNSVTCSGNTINLSSAGGATYSWSGPNSYTSTAQNNVLTNLTPSMSGTYTVTVTNAFNCSHDTTVSLTVDQTPLISSVSSGTTICAGQSFQLNAVATPTNSTYSWSGPNSYTSTSQNNTVANSTVPQSGVYTVTATQSGCSSIASTVSVTVNPDPIAVATISNTVICSGMNATLNGSGGGNYAWSGPGGFSATTQTTSVNNATVGAGGTYTLTVTNSFNCSDDTTVSLTVNQTPSPVITTGASTCDGDTLVLNANGTGIINWYSDSTLTTLVAANTSTFTPTAPGTSTYYLTVTSANGCTNPVTATVTANNFNLQTSATASPNTGYAPLNVSFGSMVSGSTNPIYNWVFGDGNLSANANPSNTFNNGGTFTVTLTVTDPTSGCMDTVNLLIKVDDGLIVIIPNIFTPNGDDINDVFSTTIRGAKSADGLIFNRWGQLVYSWDALNGNWDGVMINGNDATDGTYFYLIKVTSNKGEVKQYNGPLTLVR